jgi:copper chaperone CopZ
MCKETFSVVGLSDQRTAYEVEQYLRGIPTVNQAQADFIEGQITVDYDENRADQDEVLDHIEHAGCKPSPRINGVMDHLKTKLRSL